MNAKVLLAVLKRNFVAYFANPTGYVFICLFVLVSTVAAFWPNEFFNTNLANLDQLNKVFPFVMLMFIPAISMAVWADERRQGTDELLLTIPAGDLEIVLGKYLATVAIFSVSLLFSLVSNFIVLRILGNPDSGLFFGTYVGYWLVGLAMLSIGMVASFLTSNLTVAYILGAAFNVPLVFAVYADSIMPHNVALDVKQWSVGERFTDFGHGLITLSGLVYFLGIVAVMLYLCMVLIGRRHWSQGRGGAAMAGHFTARTLALLVIAGGAILLTSAHDARVDVTNEKISSLSEHTIGLLDKLDINRPVQIEAFISPTVPENYIQTQRDLRSTLRELEARGKGKVTVRINNTEPFSEEADRAEKRYGITARPVVTTNRGTRSRDEIFMGVAFTSGLEKVILPFIDRGIPVEYELVRSIATVTQQKRKKIGILKTDAQLFGGFDFQSGQRPDWPIVDELKKQYEVVEIDPSKPITDDVDALLAVQPSSLGPDEMNNFIAAVKSGLPTAIFEDPFPIFASQVPATSAPRKAPGGMNPMFGGQQPPPKGDIRPLWAALGIDFSGDKVVWQDYNPLRGKFSDLPKEFIFVDHGEGSSDPFNESDDISSKLQQLLLPFPGSITHRNASDTKFDGLVRTGENTGSVEYWDLMRPGMFGQMSLNPNPRLTSTKLPYVLAAQIRGKAPAAPADDKEAKKEDEAGKDAAADKGDDAKTDDKAQEGDSEKKDEDAKREPRGLNVVLVADIDMLTRQFFEIREMGNVPEEGIYFDFDNVTFVLNTLDSLAGDTRFLDIRKRRPKHRTLTKIEERTEQARKQTDEAIEKLQDGLEKAREEEQKRLDDRVAKLQKDMEEQNLGVTEIMNRVGLVQQDGKRRLEAKMDRLEQEKQKETNRIKTELNLEVRSVQDQYKLWAVLLPPIPPLLVGIGVFLTRRRREREGVSRKRLRK